MSRLFEGYPLERIGSDLALDGGGVSRSGFLTHPFGIARLVPLDP